MLRLESGLDEGQLDAIAELERRTVAADGGRLKLEWRVLRSRPTDQTSDLLWWQDGELVGFLGLYAFGGAPVELAGMVDPDHRRRGIGRALVDAALPLCADLVDLPPLLVVPGASAGGRALAARLTGTLDHSEHALVLRQAPDDGPGYPSLTLRAAHDGDGEAVAQLTAGAFGDDLETARARIPRDLSETVIAEVDGELVGALRAAPDDGSVGVYGFAVLPDRQGRGIGRDVLRRVCRQAFADGASDVHLEVAVDNPHALGLYTSLGFTPVSTEDYYAIPLPTGP